MHFIASSWWLWLVGILVCFIVAIVCQARNMDRNLHRLQTGDDVERSLTRILLPLFLAAIGCMVFCVLLVIGVIINVVQYLKDN